MCGTFQSAPRFVVVLCMTFWLPSSSACRATAMRSLFIHLSRYVSRCRCTRCYWVLVELDDSQQLIDYRSSSIRLDAANIVYSVLCVHTSDKLAPRIWDRLTIPIVQTVRPLNLPHLMFRYGGFTGYYFFSLHYSLWLYDPFFCIYSTFINPTSSPYPTQHFPTVSCM